MKVFIVYWVDLNGDCLKKSEVEILAAFSNITEANQMANDYYHIGHHNGDDRFYYVRIKELEVDYISPKLKKKCEQYSLNNSNDRYIDGSLLDWCGLGRSEPTTQPERKEK